MAAAKGNTLLNYAGVKPDLLPLCATLRSLSKVSICQEVISLFSLHMNYANIVLILLILPWNLSAEVIASNDYVFLGWNICYCRTKVALSQVKVLVTGAHGFIGYHCLSKLLDRGYEVHALSSTKRSDFSPVIWHQADLFLSSQISSLISDIKPTHLLHLAWYTDHGHFWNSTENLAWVQASLSLMRSFLESGGKRYVGAGTCAEYDWTYKFCSENTTPCCPNTYMELPSIALI